MKKHRPDIFGRTNVTSQPPLSFDRVCCVLVLKEEAKLLPSKCGLVNMQIQMIQTKLSAIIDKKYLL